MPWPRYAAGIACGHVDCCDQSPNRHATKHFRATRHPIIEAYDPPEGWGWCASYQGGVLACIKPARGLAFRGRLDEFLIEVLPTELVLRNPLRPGLRVLGEPRCENRCQSVDGGSRERREGGNYRCVHEPITMLAKW